MMDATESSVDAGAQQRLLDRLSWRLIGTTVLVGAVLALPSESLWDTGWVAPVRYGLPLGIAAWLSASWPWFAFSVLTGLNIVLVATVLSNLGRARLGMRASLTLAVVAGPLFGCVIFAAGGVPFRGGSYPWHEFGVEVLTWGIAAATYYSIEHARLITWKGLAIIFVFAVLNQIRADANTTGPDVERVLSTMARALISLAAAMPIVLGVVATLNRFPEPGRRQYRALAVAVIASAAVGVLLPMGIKSKGHFIDFTDPHPIPHFAKGYQANFLRFAVLGALFAAAYSYYRNESSAAAALQQAELDQAKLGAQMDEARLQVLQAQIEPHFLFNTLAHVKRLYHADPRVARDMLDNLMRYFAVALPQMRASDSTVEREVALAEAYLNIERIRMGRRLSFEISLPDALLGARLPPMMLLTLVENAVRHGLAPLPEGGFIRIGAGADDGSLEVTVADTGCGFTKSFGTGTGLANIRARLAALYGDTGRLGLKPNSPRGVTACLAVPLAMAATQTAP